MKKVTEKEKKTDVAPKKSSLLKVAPKKSSLEITIDAYKKSMDEYKELIDEYKELIDKQVKNEFEIESLNDIRKNNIEYDLRIIEYSLLGFTLAGTIGLASRNPFICAILGGITGSSAAMAINLRKMKEKENKEKDKKDKNDR